MSDQEDAVPEEYRPGDAAEEPEEIRADYRPGDAAEEPLEQDLESEADQIEEAVSEARPADPRIAEPPS